MGSNPVIDPLSILANLISIHDFTIGKRLNRQERDKKIEELKVWFQKQIEIARLKSEANNSESIALRCCVIGLIFAACYTYVPLNREFKVLNIGLGSIGFLASREASSKRKKIRDLSREEEKQQI